MTRNRFQPIRGFRKTAKDLFLWIKEWFHHSKKVLFVYQSLQARGFSKPSVYLVDSTTFLLIPQKSVQTRFPASKVWIPSKVQIRKNHPNDMAGSDWPWTNFGRWELQAIELIEFFFQSKKVNFEEQFTVDKMRELFKLKDHDDNGFIAKGDVRVLCKSLGFYPDDKVLDKLIHESDIDQNEVIDFEEFVELGTLSDCYRSLFLICWVRERLCLIGCIILKALLSKKVQ